MTLLLATRNAHKVSEIRAILGETHRYCTLDDVPGAPAIVEDRPTMAGNAIKKASELARWVATAWASGLAFPKRAETNPEIAQPPMVLADDSGLEVDALGGAPGVHSARFAALDTGQPGNSSDAENIAKLLR